MKLSVAIDRDGNVISLHEPAKNAPSAGSSGVKMRAPKGGKVLSLDAPPGLAGKSLVEIHDLVRVDFSGPAPVLRHKKS
ncbi:MAG TPA: hypothetical protein VEI03_20605 [Stellaceae bacterium]|nr:hypothetical protein [Stellaceae bacterium]